MKFSNEKAMEIVQTFSLSEATINTWKSRKAIPDRYKSGIKKEEINSADEKQQLKNLHSCLKTGKFNLTALCKLIGPNFSPGIVKDFLRGKGRISRHDFIALKKAINTLRNESKEVLRELDRKSELPESAELKIRTFLMRKELYWFVLFGRERSIRNKFDGWQRNKRSFPEEARDQLKSYLLIFLTVSAI
jgi:hypothetical protein